MTATAIKGPSVGFVSLTRNPKLVSPERFIPTVKGENDVVISGALSRFRPSDQARSGLVGSRFNRGEGAE